MEHRAVAYLLRQKQTVTQLLVFEVREDKQQGWQVPKGTLEPGETAEDGMRRELLEESGLREVRDLRPLGTLEHRHTEPEVWHIFGGWLDPKIPDAWTWEVTGKGEDQGQHFEHFWVPLAEAAPRLAYMAAGLPFLHDYIAQTGNSPLLRHDGAGRVREV